MKTIPKRKFVAIVKKAHSKSEICRQCDWHVNGTGLRRVNVLLEKYALDTSHFDLKLQNRVYARITKTCPVCGNKFETQGGHPREKTVCSYACSNTHFRSGTNNGNYKHGRGKDSEYRTICFQHFEKECVLCGWDLTVDVHHVDGDHKNDAPANLIPLCPNHHRLTVTRAYKDDIAKQIATVIEDKQW